MGDQLDIPLRLSVAPSFPPLPPRIPPPAISNSHAQSFPISVPLRQCHRSGPVSDSGFGPNAHSVHISDCPSGARVGRDLPMRGRKNRLVELRQQIFLQALENLFGVRIPSAALLANWRGRWLSSLLPQTTVTTAQPRRPHGCAIEQTRAIVVVLPSVLE